MSVHQSVWYPLTFSLISQIFPVYTEPPVSSVSFNPSVSLPCVSLFPDHPLLSLLTSLSPLSLINFLAPFSCLCLFLTELELDFEALWLVWSILFATYNYKQAFLFVLYWEWWENSVNMHQLHLLKQRWFQPGKYCITDSKKETLTNNILKCSF